MPDPDPDDATVKALRVRPAGIGGPVDTTAPTLGGGGGGAGPEGAPAPERRVAGYDLLEVIGRGGMGVVYRARHRSLGKVVALKLLAGGGAADVARFVHEARALAELSHPNIMPVHDVGQSEGTWFFTMDLAEGGTLASLVRAASGERDLSSRRGGRRDRLRGTLVPLERALALLEKVARAVAYAHERGIIHRDLKPSNVLLREDGEPLVADFGLARRVETPLGITHTGEVVGTLAYMAPEQAAGEGRVDERADVYALGGILHELLTGAPPLEMTGIPAQDLIRALTSEPESPRRRIPSLPVEVETILMRALAREPSRRYPSARALAEDIRRYRDGEPILARPPSLAARLLRLARRRKVPLAIGALALTAAAALGVAAHLARLRAAEQGRRWQEVFASSFERADDLAAWRPLEGEWRVEGGALAVRGGAPARVLLERPLAGDVAVEFAARLLPLEGRASGDLSLALVAAGAPDVLSGYFVGFGSNGNAGSKILRRGREVAVATGTAARIEPGRLHRVAVERAGGEVRLRVDGRDVLAYRDLFPLDLGRRTQVMIYTWDAEARFEEVTVRERAPALRGLRAEQADWLKERGAPAAAALLYGDVADDPALAPADRADLHLAQGLAELAAAEEPLLHPGVREERLARARSTLARVEAEAPSGPTRVRAELGLARALLGGGDVAGALERAHAVLRSPLEGVREGVRDFLAGADALLAARGDVEGRALVLALTLERFEDDAATDADLRRERAECLAELGRVREAEAVLDAALARHAADAFRSAMLRLERAKLRMSRGDAEGAVAEAARLEASLADGDYWKLEALLVRSDLTLDAGDAGAARALWERATALAASRGEHASGFLARRAGHELRRGDLSRTRREVLRSVLDEAVAGPLRAPGVGEWWGAHAALEVALDRLRSGEEAAARAGLVRACDLPAVPMSGLRAQAALLAALLDIRAGDREAARRRLRAIADLAVRAPALRRLAAALAEGPVEPAAAARILESCGEETRRRAVTALALGVDAAARGEAAAAREHLAAAAAAPSGPWWAREAARALLGDGR
jgi:serine/threonine-protein kinase